MTTSRFIKKDEIKRVVKTLAKTRNGTRNTAIVMFLTYTGARVNEAFKVKLGDLYDFDSGKIKEQMILKDTKGGTDRLIFISAKLQGHLQQYFNDSPRIHLIKSNSDNPLFPSERNIQKFIRPVSGCRLVNNILTRAGVETTSHGFRKQFCYNLRALTKDLHICMTAMGHKNPSTTSIYWKGDEMEVHTAVSNLNLG